MITFFYLFLDHQKTNKNKRSKRDRCSYGAHCYRTNPIHRQTESHPGDSDWEETEDETERCPHGDNCYRKNPEHIKEFHPEKLKSLKRKTTRKGKSRRRSFTRLHESTL